MLNKANGEALCYSDLVERFGSESAMAILKTLEQFEGVREEWVSGMSKEERLDNVYRLMGESVLYQTRH